MIFGQTVRGEDPFVTIERSLLVAMVRNNYLL